MTRLAVIGAGVMGEALVSGLLRAGWSSDAIVVADRRDFRRAEMTAAHGVRATGNAEAAAEADTVILVVKPQDVGAVLPEIAPVLRPGTLVVSLCAASPPRSAGGSPARRHGRPGDAEHAGAGRRGHGGGLGSAPRRPRPTWHTRWN